MFAVQANSLPTSITPIELVAPRSERIARSRSFKTEHTAPVSDEAGMRVSEKLGSMVFVELTSPV